MQREVLMAKLGVFMNLSPDLETEARFRVLEHKLDLKPQDVDRVYGRGVYAAYYDLAYQLVSDNPAATVFAATCYPTTHWLSETLRYAERENQAGIVFAGLTDAPSTSYRDNVTGIRSFDPAVLCPNWPYLLCQLQPGITRMAVIYDFNVGGGLKGQYTAIQSVTSPPFDKDLDFTEIDARLSACQIESQIYQFLKDADTPGTSGLIVTGGTLTAISRRELGSLAAKYGLPAIYPNSQFVSSGGLMSYGPNVLELYQRGAELAQPILAGEVSPADIKNQIPIVTNNQFELVISRTAAEMLGLLISNVPKTFTVWVSGAKKVITPRVVS
jgi:hypothetical protein